MGARALGGAEKAFFGLAPQLLEVAASGVLKPAAYESVSLVGVFGVGGVNRDGGGGGMTEVGSGGGGATLSTQSHTRTVAHSQRQE